MMLMPRKINISAFKERCLSLLENLDAEGLIITKHGEPVAEVRPLSTDSSELIGSLKGKLKITGSILSTGAKWNAQS